MRFSVAMVRNAHKERIIFLNGKEYNLDRNGAWLSHERHLENIPVSNLLASIGDSVEQTMIWLQSGETTYVMREVNSGNQWLPGIAIPENGHLLLEARESKQDSY